MECLDRCVARGAALGYAAHPLFFQFGFLKDCFSGLGESVSWHQESCEVPDEALLEQVDAVGRQAGDASLRQQ